MSRIALHDADRVRSSRRTAFPNLALMKLSSWHKAKGDSVEWFLPVFSGSYERVYSSKVFSFTPDDPYLPGTVLRGGTWCGPHGPALPDEIEHSMPDYSIYPRFRASLGFVTRGCPNACSWCIVPKKEGSIRPHAEIREFLRPDCRNVVLMDNNILASEHGIAQLEQSIAFGLRIDCNQGLDARLVATDMALARLLARIRWIRHIRFACDSKSQMPSVEKAVSAIRRHSVKKFEFFCYVLVKDIDDALERVEFLRRINVTPFAQPYREPGSKAMPAGELRRFARWVNHRAIFATVPWAEYQPLGRTTH